MFVLFPSPFTINWKRFFFFFALVSAQPCVCWFYRFLIHGSLWSFSTNLHNFGPSLRFSLSQTCCQLAVLVPTKAVGLEFVLTNVKTTHSVRQSREPSVVVRLVVANVVYNRVQRSHAQPDVQQDTYSTHRDALLAHAKVLTLSPREYLCTDTWDSAITPPLVIVSCDQLSSLIAPNSKLTNRLGSSHPGKGVHFQPAFTWLFGSFILRSAGLLPSLEC